MPLLVVPDGDPLLEGNDCHNPAGTPNRGGGRFCAKEDTFSGTEGLKGGFKKPSKGTRGTVDRVSVDSWSVGLEGEIVSRADLEQFGRDIVSHLPGEWTITVRHNAISARIEIDEVGGKGSIRRVFQQYIRPINATGPVERYVEHDYFKLPKEAQRQGVGKDIMREQMAFYDRLNVRTVDVYANIGVGGYAWARVGWQPSGSWVKNLKNQIMAKAISDAEEADVEALFRRFGPEDGKVAWALADREDGPKLLMNTSWQGTLNLKDAETRERIAWYLQPGRTQRRQKLHSASR